MDRSTIASWETGRRIPDAVLLSQISQCLGADTATLLGATEANDQKPSVIVVDDEKIILNGEVPVLEDALPNASVTGFTRPSAALAFAKNTKIALAFLDIEMGQINGLDLCRDLLKIHPNTNVIFLTAYMEYSFQAWDTGACGFLLKPITTKTVRHQLGLLRYPVRGLI